MMLIESSASMGSFMGMPITIVGMPFFRTYVTHFDNSQNPSERRIFTAPAGPTCQPELWKTETFVLAAKTKRERMPHKVHMHTLMSIRRKHQERATLHQMEKKF